MPLRWIFVFSAADRVRHSLLTVYSLDELSHVLTQCFAARPLTLSMTVKGMGAALLLVTVDGHK